VSPGLLEATGIVLRRGGLVAVDRVDLRAEPGRVTAVIGPNGAGKTTLFDCLSGVLKPEAGSVRLDSVELTQRTADERSRLGVLRTFQRSSVFASLTVRENLLAGAENRDRQPFLRAIAGLRERRRPGAASMADRVLGELDLATWRDVPAGLLPTGTLRLVELARAICANPSVLLLDEPASGLDDEEVEALGALLRRLAARGLCLVLVEHDIDLVQAIADVVYAMAAGQVLAVGTPAEIVERPDVRTLVLGMAE